MPPASSASKSLPEFGRWRDVERLFGIKRGTLYNLLAEGKVKSISMRRKGSKHGCRLFYLPGISEYLHSLLQGKSHAENQPTNKPGCNIESKAQLTHTANEQCEHNNRQ